MENKTLALNKLDLRVIELLEELKEWAEAFAQVGDPLDGYMPNLPALRSLAQLYPETPDLTIGPDENGVYHFGNYVSMLFNCKYSVCDGLPNECEMWINHLKSQS